ncbi:MAG: hypothetical protein GXX83_01920 [Gaiellales bacterium]|nr:hypothetical protein [Gaiellales bacterium]
MDEAAQREQGPAGSGAGRGLRDLVERALYVGLGAAAVSRDRLQPVVDEFVERGRMSAEDGRALMDRVAERSREEFHALVGRVERTGPDVGSGSASGAARSLENMEFRLLAVEHRLDLLERQFNGWSEPSE